MTKDDLAAKADGWLALSAARVCGRGSVHYLQGLTTGLAGG
jgi:hypothetical protein